MTKLIRAVMEYGPRINLNKAASPSRYMELITQRTTLSSGVVKNVQDGEVETLVGLLREGRPVHTGVAIYTPSVDLDGRIAVSVRVDRRVVRRLNDSDVFEGTILNAENIGKSSAEIAALWNEAHPTDPVM